MPKECPKCGESNIQGRADCRGCGFAFQAGVRTYADYLRRLSQGRHAGVTSSEGYRGAGSLRG
jgi:uncharacterized membrane protein YvbJ